VGRGGGERRGAAAKRAAAAPAEAPATEEVQGRRGQLGSSLSRSKQGRKKELVSLVVFRVSQGQLCHEVLF
jgi:hypothetical protein